jgi:sulfatase modifying factor 1
VAGRGLWCLIAAGSACGRLDFDARIDGGSGVALDGAADAGDAAVAAICRGGLAPTCGPTGLGDCCASPLVTGGAYARSYDMAADAMFPLATYTATVSDYRLDKYEITVGRFRQFVAAGMGTQASPPASGAGAHPGLPGSGWDPAFDPNLVVDPTALQAALACNALEATWTNTPGANENKPINCITWYEAMAFCAWDGGYLPSEVQWDYAAAGGSQQRPYPWSSSSADVTIDGTHASYFDGTDCVGDGLPGCAATDIIAVGTKPAGDGRWGHSDLGGNLWEWTLDANHTPYAINPCNDCADVVASGGRTARGGYYFGPIVYVRSANRFGNGETFRSRAMGARCARGP